jgi:hypothetical protein
MPAVVFCGIIVVSLPLIKKQSMASNEIEKISSPLPIDESIGLQNRARFIQQIGIAIIFIVMIMAGLGLFGQGILSNKKVEADGNIVSYEKFGRYGGESKLVFDLVAADDSVSQIAIPAAYFDHFKIETIVPEPDKTSSVNKELIFTFSGSAAKQITFFLSPHETGSIEATIKGNQTSFKLSHFIYP